MNKLLKVFLILLLVSTFLCSFSYATEDEENDVDAVSAEEVNSRISDLTTSTVTNVLPMNNYSQANIELNNILCIILIAVGVVIILLAIAILIKLKK